MEIGKLAELLGGEVRGGQVLAPGPGHSATDASMSVKLDTTAPDGFIIHSFAGDDPAECRRYVIEKLGITKPKKREKPWTLIAEHVYRTENGAPLLRVRRCWNPNLNRKEYPQSHWDGSDWIKGAPNSPKIPYHLPQLLAASPKTSIYFVEGEKCADQLVKIGFVSTTASGGCQAPWDKALTVWFKDRPVIVLVDADQGGREHGQKIARALNGTASSIKVVDLFPQRADGSDVADWLANGDPTGARLVRECIAAPLWEPNMASAADPASTSDTAAATVSILLMKQADALIELANQCELFHTPAGDAYADVTVNGHRETYRVRSKAFRSWLAHRFYVAREGAPNSEAMNSALGVIEARAVFASPQRTVHVRVASEHGKFYLDLADDQWRVIEIDAEGWRLIELAPVRFRRASGMLPLPEPASGGRIESLRPLVNVRDDDDFVLTVSWLLSALRPNGPYPVIALAGEQGSSKSTASALMRGLVDPNVAPLRALPREDRDLFIYANNAHALVFDNVSGLQPWISDTLCRLATGGGFGVRTLYSDDAETLFDSSRPIILNGIEDVATRPDLVDRSIMLSLPTIDEKRRRPEQELWATFHAERPAILGALLDAISHGIAHIDEIKPNSLPRMADHYRWVTACEGALWKNGTFAAAFDRNARGAVNVTIEADLVASAVWALMAGRAEWEGRASDLLGTLGLLIPEAQRRSKQWPTEPNHLSGRLRRVAPVLRKVGVKVDHHRDNKGSRIKMQFSEEPEQSSSPSSAVGDSKQSDRDDAGDDQLAASVTAKSWENQVSDGHDDGDDVSDLSSGGPTCSQCQRAPDGKEREYLIDGDRVWLHPECMRFYEG